MNNILDQYQKWCNHAIFALKGIIFKQSHHYLDHLDAYFTEPFNSNLQSYFTKYLLTVARNPGYLTLVLSTYPLLFGPIYLPLNEMKRVYGPEKDNPGYEPIFLFELVVLHKKKEIRRGWSPPPLLTSFTLFQTHRQLIITDGSHRHEALARSGYYGYYTIISYNPSDTKYLNEYLYSLGIKTKLCP